ncbi:MAG: aKG-HExxH-type peptide beta-hydroxylase [Pseudonocardiaceae bacterium]
MYQLAAELLEANRPALDIDVIDCPIARNRIGDALAGRSRLVHSELVGISAVAGDAGPVSSETDGLRVVSRPPANTLLAGALDTMGTQLGSQQAAFGRLRLLTAAQGQRFSSALGTLSAGVAIARSASPDLVDDLLAHVVLVGIIDPRYAGRLVSASTRTFPGLVVLGTRSSIAVAEALVHEGAHQKLFDLAITHHLIDTDSDRCPPFHPPWAPADRLWSLEQAFAAGHTYACLAQFGEDAGVSEGAIEVGAESLLPVASERREIIGEWLLDRGDYLRHDAHRLLAGLLGRRPHTTRTMKSRSDSLGAHQVVSTGLEFRQCDSSDQVLVGLPSDPPQLYWVSKEAAELLKYLQYKPIDDIVDTCTQQWHISKFDASDRVAALLSDLSASGLVTAGKP